MSNDLSQSLIRATMQNLRKDLKSAIESVHPFIAEGAPRHKVKCDRRHDDADGSAEVDGDYQCFDGIYDVLQKMQAVINSC